MSNCFDHKLKHKLESKPSEGGAESGSIRRIELITGAERRRRWSSNDKTRIVMESLKQDASVSDPTSALA